MTRTEKQTETILRYMREKGGITALDAFHICGTMRLAARIFDLREQGHLIATERMPLVNKDGAEDGFYVRYSLIE